MVTPINLVEQTTIKKDQLDLVSLSENIKLWGKALGFQKIGISDIDLSSHEDDLQAWLDNHYHGEMDPPESPTI